MEFSSLLLYAFVTLLAAATASGKVPCPENIESFSAQPGKTPKYYKCIDGVAVLHACPNGTVYWQKKSKCTKNGHFVGYQTSINGYNSGSDLGFREQPGLGKTFSLGTLYNAKTDYIMNGFSLWNQDSVNKNKIVQDQEYSETDFFVEENVFDRMSHFDIKAELKLSFLGGLIEVGGSAKYLRDGKELENSIRFNMNFDATTTSESMPVHVGPTNSFLCDLVNKKDGPTHVISSITYGMKAVFVFEKTVSEKESKEEVGGSLSIAIKSIPEFSIEGSASVDVSGSLKETTKNLKVKLYGDLLLNEQPTTYEEAIKVYKTLPQKVKDKPSVVKYQLTPITYYCDKSAAILNGISANIIEETSKKLGEMQDLHQKIRTLKAADVAGRFHRIRKNLITFENGLNKFENDFKARLKVLLPKIKAGDGAELELVNLLNTYTSSPYQIEKAKIYLEKRQREIQTIGHLIKKAVGKNFIEITDNPTANDNKCIFDKKYVMLYVVNVLPEDNISDEYINGTLNEDDNPWYNNNIKVGEAGRIYKAFEGFAQENFGADHCFQIQLKRRVDLHPFNIEVFQNGVQLSSSFIIPDDVKIPTPKQRGYDRVTFQIPTVSNKYIKKVAIEFWDMINGTKDSPKREEFDVSSMVTVTGLSAKSSYWFHLRYLADVGHSVASGATLCSTTPTSPPTNLKVSLVSSSTVGLSWSKPLVVAPGLQIDKYIIQVYNQKADLVSILTSSSDQVTVSGLTDAEKYTVTCKVQLPPELQSFSDGSSVKVIYESNVASTVMFTSPKPPSAPSVLSVGHHDASLKWDVPKIANGATINEYVFIYTKVNDKSVEIDGTSKVQSSTTNTITLKALAMGTSYTCKVMVKTTLGNSIYSAGTIVTTTYEKTELQKFKDSLGLEDMGTGIATLKSRVSSLETSSSSVKSSVSSLETSSSSVKSRVSSLETSSSSVKTRVSSLETSSSSVKSKVSSLEVSRTSLENFKNSANTRIYSLELKSKTGLDDQRYCILQMTGNCPHGFQLTFLVNSIDPHLPDWIPLTQKVNACCNY